MINSNENQPFEASYEAAKQSIIGFMGEVAKAYELPIPLLNILIYEIALESRNASFSAVIGNCDVSYPENVSQGDISTPVDPMREKNDQIKKNKDFQEFKKMESMSDELELNNSSDVSA